VLALIKKKQNGDKIVASKPGRPGGKVLDLMAALKQSLANGKQTKPSAAERQKQKARPETSKRARKAALRRRQAPVIGRRGKFWMLSGLRSLFFSGFGCATRCPCPGFFHASTGLIRTSRPMAAA
jgi:hypothetical protein